MSMRHAIIGIAALAAIEAPALAQMAAAPPVRVQSAAEALAQDARAYAAMHGTDLQEAMQRLRAQEESVRFTDAIRESFRARLAGISIEHDPQFRIVVLLTGEEPVPERIVEAGGMAVPVVFRIGAPATRAEGVKAIEEHQAAIRRSLRRPPGLGLDPRTGMLVLTMPGKDADEADRDAIRRRVEKLTGIPVQIRLADQPAGNLSLGGGARLQGRSEDGKLRYVCTSGFIVTDGARTGVATAAHCPDSLVYVDKARREVPLQDFVGQWGWAYRDVQIHPTDEAAEPLFYADSAKSLMRPVTSWRNRDSTRAGDFVCQRGESTGYGCSHIELVDFAPPGDLCGGPCHPTWVTVAGPVCRSGNSGAPVFNGTIAFGIVKGGSYLPDGTCNYYFYMSTDFLPEGWGLLYRR